MAFPFKPATTDDAHKAPAVPTFSKKGARKRKQRKAAPSQKALMQGNRSLSGGSR